MKKILFSLIAFAASAIPAAMSAQAPHAERIYLSGTGLDDTKIWDFYCSAGQNSGKWRKIQVPCNWELQGFGEYTYGRWYKVKGARPSTEVGTYRHKFSAPKSWAGQRIKIFFDGVMTDTEVTINGQSAGAMHQGGFNRFSYDITDLVKPGKKNTLEVKVAKESSNKSINAAERKADWWLFGGIYRPVWIEVVPQVNFCHYALDARADGSFRAAVTMEGNAEGYKLKVSMTNLKTGEKLFTANGGDSWMVKMSNAKEQIIEGAWKNVLTWDTETPNLYVARLQLIDPQGKVTQTRDTRIGFRTIEFFPQDGVYLNGKKLIVKGVNRHSFSVDGGRTTSAVLSRQDALLIKEMNMNAVRSHYAPDEHFLDMCDSLGIVYMDELAGWQNGYDSKVGVRLVKEFIERDLNHPCVFIWSHGNEGGWNYKLDHLFAEHDKLQKRHMVHPWADFNDLDTHHYPAYLTGVARFTNGFKVFMPTEFMHAQYDQGGGAGMRDFWDRWLTNPMFAGGFIWVYCDEAVKRTDKGGILDSDKSNAPDGVVGPRREKEGSFYAIRAQWSPIQLKPLLITSHFDGSFLVTNEYIYTNLDKCRMTYKVITCNTPMMRTDEMSSVVAQGNVTLPAINPGETGTARFDIPQNFQEGDVLQLEAFDKEGRSMNTWTFPIRLVKQYYEHKLASTPATLQMRPAATATKGSDNVTLKSENIEITFDANTGMISRIVTAGKEVPFGNGPVAVGMKMRYDLKASYVRQDGRNAIFCAKYKGGADSIVWKLTDDGLLHMDALLLNRASGGGGFDDAFMDTEVYNLGLTFSYPEDSCTGMTWMGRGAYRVWKNRIAGTNYGVWHKDYNNTITGESFENLVYPEFKGYHANMYWATLESKTTPFTVYSRNDGIFYRIFTPEEPVGRAGGKRTQPAFPEGDISFLLDIPAINSYKPIEQQGPNSQPGNIRIKSGDEGLHINLTFDFR